MRYRFIESHRAEHSVVVMCGVLEVSRSGYYAWRRRPESRRKREDRHLQVRIRAEFHASRQTYGTPRVHHSLKKQGIRCSRKRISRLMRSDGLRPKKARRFRTTTHAAVRHPKAANVLARNFTTEAPDRVWVGDITYLWTNDGWLYLAVLIDLYSRRVVGWATQTRLTTELPLAALRNALFEREPGRELLHHSDRGCQYTSDQYQQVLRERGIQVSMSGKGDCWDNAVVESFFATLKVELGDTFLTRRSAQAELFDYIEVFYNRQRMHTSVGWISPSEAETAFNSSKVV